MPALDRLAAAGFPVTEVLGAGMEGVVVGLDDDRVVKLWDGRGSDELARLRTFYDAVHASGFALAVPRILEILEVGDRTATIQQRLTGRPLWTDQDTSPPRDLGSAVVEALVALASVPVTPAMAVLPVPDGEPAFAPTVPFAASLADLVERRTGVLVPHLSRDDERRVLSLAAALRALPLTEPRLVHGDLGPSNILAVAGRATALLDFGYLSTVGDPAFDAAVAVALFDMFGTDADAGGARLDRLVVDRFGYDAERLHLYRAAYGLVTASCLAAASTGRHFRWCLDLWRRPATGRHHDRDR